MAEDIFSRYNREDIIHSMYFYPDCDVLINKLGIKEEKVLTAIEEDLTNQRLAELIREPIRGRFGILHLKNIHKYIFQDIYPFAGKFREEDIWKGDTFFCKSQFIYQTLDDLFKKLREDKYLINLGLHEFTKCLAFYMSELNIVHPFREGNGRVIREYIRCLALKRNYIIDWSLVDDQELLKASIISVDKNLTPLISCLYKAIEK
jgi:cell filamentation protein